MTCAELYERIQLGLGVANMGLTPHQVAEVARYGLLGPWNSKTNLPATNNSCRLTVNLAVTPARKKKIDFPILVIDEFNPTDFDDTHWPDNTEFTLYDLTQDNKMGESLKFFSELAGLAYLQNGFVVFVGTKSKAVTRALLAINCGTKAALAPSTKLPRSGPSFEDWRGFQWTDDCKESLLAKLYQRRFQEALRENGNSNENTIQERWEAAAHSCMQQPDIRFMCNMMLEEVEDVEYGKNLLLQSRTQDADSGGFCVDFGDQLKGACAIM
jgi:hypothetical protein